MQVLTINFKSGSKLEIQIKKALTPIDFRQLLATLRRDTCITDLNLVDGYYYIDVNDIDSVSLTEKKNKKQTLKETT